MKRSFGCDLRRVRIASKPLKPGSRKSISTTSAASRPQIAQASSPDPASATTTMSGCKPIIAASPKRTTGWSSTIIIQSRRYPASCLSVHKWGTGVRYRSERSMQIPANRERSKPSRDREGADAAHALKIRETVNPGILSKLMNRLYYGDNLTVLRGCIDNESVDLVYLDPPFNSQATYNVLFLSLIHISEPTRLGMISYAVFCLKKKKISKKNRQQ